MQKSLNNDKLNKLLEFYKQYKLTLNDLALLKLAHEHIAKDQMLMQKFLKIAISELELSRTKLLVSIRRLIEKERLSKVRSTEDERKIFIYMDEKNIKKFDSLFNDVEEFLDI